MTINPKARISKLRRRQRLVAAGSLLGAFAASSCCLLPLALFGLGVSSAWIGNLTQLALYQPYFIATAVGFLGYGFWLAYRGAKPVCSGESACVHPLASPLVKMALVLATVLVVAAVGFDLLAPLFLNS